MYLYTIQTERRNWPRPASGQTDWSSISSRDSTIAHSYHFLPYHLSGQVIALPGTLAVPSASGEHVQHEVRLAVSAHAVSYR